MVFLVAKKRDLTQKTKQLKKEGWVPGCVYGKGQRPIHIQIKETMLKNFLSSHSPKLELEIQGIGKFLVGSKEIQKGSFGNKLEHISFKSMKTDELSTLSIEVHIEGKATGELEGGMTHHLLHEITVKGYPKDLPDSITVNIGELNIGEFITIENITDHYNFEFLREDYNKAIVKCQHPKVLELPTANTRVKTATNEEATSEFEESTSVEEKKQAA